MFFEQIKTPGLGCFSYAIGCPQAGVLAIVDPRRDIGVYLDFARKHGMSITHIFETHVHADHISGARELARATGAKIYIHESALVGYEAEKLSHGQKFTFGPAHVEVLHTPGHTPNSVSLIVTDTMRSGEPEMILTGDLLFVGDTGRPDLPGDEILDEQVQNLYDSLNRVLGHLPDGLEVYPAHGEGSLCGAGMSARPYSTLGYERKANPRLRLKNFDEFKKSVMFRLPMRPQSFSHIIATNLKGAPLLAGCEKTAVGKALTPGQVEKMQKEGAIILDVRDYLSFGGAHITGSVNVDATENSAINWIGTVVAPGSKIILVLSANDDFERMEKALLSIGYDDIAGYLDKGIRSWISAGKPTQALAHVSAADLKKWLTAPEPPLVIDVRNPWEFEENHLPGSVNMTFDEIVAGKGCPGDPDKPKVTLCRSGYRSSIAASVLQANGCRNLSLLAGGIALMLDG